MSSLPNGRRPSLCVKEKSGTSCFSLRRPWIRTWYRRRSQIRQIARLQSGNGTMYCSSGSTTQRLSLDLIHSMPLDPSSHCQGIRVLCPFMLLDTHWRHTRKRRTPIHDDLISVECKQQWPEFATADSDEFLLCWLLLVFAPSSCARTLVV